MNVRIDCNCTIRPLSVHQAFCQMAINNARLIRQSKYNVISLNALTCPDGTVFKDSDNGFLEFIPSPDLRENAYFITLLRFARQAGLIVDTNAPLYVFRLSRDGNLFNSGPLSFNIVFEEWKNGETNNETNTLHS